MVPVTLRVFFRLCLLAPGGDMGISLRPVVAICLCAILAACNAPRGAGFQSEVIAAASETGEEAQASGFQVVAVTRENQASLAAWPELNQLNYRWIRHVDQPASMIIATGDQVSVTVWDTDDNSLLAGAGGRVAQLQDQTVGTDGTVFLPFVGDLRIAGMSPQSARQRIEDRYAETIPSAQVQIHVIAGRQNTVNLVAGVGSPGVYPLEGRNVTLLSILAQSGGVQPNLTNPHVKLIRGSEVYSTSVARLFENPDLDPALVGGDRVIIENESRSFLSLGAAGSEAEHVFPSDNVNALEALTIIGGVDEGRANPKGILILREYEANDLRVDGSGPEKAQVVFTLDLTTADGLFAARNFEIMPDDLVYVTESPIAATRSVIGLIGSVFGIANNF